MISTNYPLFPLSSTTVPKLLLISTIVHKVILISTSVHKLAVIRSILDYLAEAPRSSLSSSGSTDQLGEGRSVASQLKSPTWSGIVQCTWLQESRGTGQVCRCTDLQVCKVPGASYWRTCPIQSPSNPPLEKCNCKKGAWSLDDLLSSGRDRFHRTEMLGWPLTDLLQGTGYWPIAGYWILGTGYSVLSTDL